MPFVLSDTYPWLQAVELAEKACPDEDPTHQLLLALSTIRRRRPALVGYVVCSKTSVRYEISPAAALSSDDLQIDAATGWARYRVHRRSYDRVELIVSGQAFVSRSLLNVLLASAEPVSGAGRPGPQPSGVSAEGATPQDERRAKTETRDQEIQAAAEKIWKGDHTLTKEGVARSLHANTSNKGLIADHRDRHGGALSIESLQRLIRRPKWVSKRQRKKEI